jgi:hypothetical protein
LLDPLSALTGLARDPGRANYSGGANAKRRQMSMGVIAAAFGVGQLARLPEMTISPQAV